MPNCETCLVTYDGYPCCPVCNKLLFNFDTRGHDHAAICRTNKCGQYDKEQDACLLVIEIGKRKGQKRAGKVSWLYGHPDAECPSDPPMWSVEDGEKADAVGGGTNS